MADYISREDAVSQIFDKVWTKTDEDGYIWVLRRDVIYTLDDITTADVVEVVRCKDCELWCMTMPEDERKKAAENPWTDGVCELYESDGFSPNDFCSNARRRRGWQLTISAAQA